MKNGIPHAPTLESWIKYGYPTSAHDRVHPQALAQAMEMLNRKVERWFEPYVAGSHVAACLRDCLLGDGLGKVEAVGYACKKKSRRRAEMLRNKIKLNAVMARKWYFRTSPSI